MFYQKVAVELHICTLERPVFFFFFFLMLKSEVGYTFKINHSSFFFVPLSGEKSFDTELSVLKKCGKSTLYV